MECSNVAVPTRNLQRGPVPACRGCASLWNSNMIYDNTVSRKSLQVQLNIIKNLNLRS